MPTHATEIVLPYTQQQLYDLVADIGNYPKFIPWCEAARVWGGEGNVVLAELVIRFKGISGKYTSRVSLDNDNHKISVELAEGPFEYLYQNWEFSGLNNGSKVVFNINFSLRSKFLEKIVDLMFQDTCQKMLQAFKMRADEIYCQ